jgi:hypothetical protein
MMSVESDRAIAMAVNPVSGESNSRRQRSEPRGEHHVGAAVAGHCVWARSRSLSARRPKVRFLWALRRETDPGEERCDTVLVLFWQTGLTMRADLWAYANPLTQHRCRAYLHRENFVTTTDPRGNA